MAHGKETPRQKMIGMMYLVLMALLALNVSKDVLEAFVLVDEGLTKTTENFAQKNDVFYEEFDRAAAENPVKAAPWQAKATEVKRRSDELYQYIQDLKFEIIRGSEGEDTEVIHDNQIHHGHSPKEGIKGKDNNTVPAEIMIGAANDGKANDLKMAIDDFRDHLLSLVGEESESVISSIESNLDTHDPPTVDGVTHTWQSEHFEHLPLIAVITIMSKMQSDVRNAETEILEYLYTQIDAGSFKFNLIEPVVIAQSNHVVRGGAYEADVFMAAFDTTQEPIVYIGKYDSTISDDGTVEYNMVGELGRDYDTIPVKGGKGMYKVATSSGSPTGWKDWGGIISLKRMDGSYTNKPFTSGYTLAPQSLVVSPTAMNVFYQAVDNPVEVSVPGYSGSAIRATINNGRMRGSGTNYTVVPTREGTADVSVSVNVDGTTRSMGSKRFRVEKVPDPFPTIAGKKGGTVGKGEILLEMGLKAEMPEWFKFDLEFRITSFTLSATVGGFLQESRSTSPNFSAEMRQTIQGMRSGTRVYFTECQAVGPDGSTRDIGTLAVKLR
jgi:gliding motility-associated protein GldM